MEFDFPTEVESVDTVPEPYRGLYTQGESGFTLDSALGKRFSDAQGAITALSKERRTLGSVKSELGKFQALGLSIEEIQELAKLRGEKAQGDGKDEKGEAEWKRMREQLLTTHQRDIAERDKRYEDLQGKYRSRIAMTEAQAALSELKGSARLLMPQVRDALKVVEGEGGELEVRVLDKHGNERIGNSGAYLTVKEYVAELKADPEFAIAFEGSGARGAGTQQAGQSGASGGGKRYSKQEWLEVTSRATPEDRAKLLRDKGAGLIVVQG